MLDIGTGSGLLSMMAVQLGADTVTACEAFRPMANTAEKIFRANGMADKITLIKRRSTDIVVGQNMDRRANILVTEVFDTELIGEGAIEIFNHAHKELLEEDCLVVPHLARVYGQLVQSPYLEGFNKLKSIADLDGEVVLTTSKKLRNCPGTNFLFDVQLSQYVDKFIAIAPPQKIMEFDFSGKEMIPNERKAVNEFTAQNGGGTVQAIFFWWDLLMDEEGDIVLSCAPSWAHPDFEMHRNENDLNVPDKDVIPWRDHWMQAIYFPPETCQVYQGDSVSLVSHHGEFSWWFGVFNDPSAAEKAQLDEPFCTCGLHQSCSRYRIGQMNYSLRNKEFLKHFDHNIDNSSTVLSIGHGSVISLAAVSSDAKQIYCYDDSSIGSTLIADYVQVNNLTNVTTITQVDKIPFHEVTHIVGEPYFANNILPWHSLRFFNIVRQLYPKLKEEVNVFPSEFRIYCIPVEFLHLHKISRPMGVVNTFNVKELDNLLAKAYEVADDKLEPHSLFDYPCIALCDPIPVHSIAIPEYLTDGPANILQFELHAKIET